MDSAFQHYIKPLALDGVANRLAEHCYLADTKAAALRLFPQNSVDAVRQSLNKTEAAYLLSVRYGAPSFGTVQNMNPALSRAERGASLSMQELLEIAEILRVVRSVKGWYANFNAEKSVLTDDFERLFPNKYFEEKIHAAIVSEDEMNDRASAELAEIRRKIAGKSAKIRDQLEKIVRGSTAKFLQEALITQRDGRFVVPVKSEYKNEIRGIVHDTSASGSTLFVEPMGVVETNNEIRVLRMKEQEEIARILAELSAEAAQFSESIQASFESLVQLDLLFAKAKLAVDMRASVPKLNDNGYVYLKNARHPFLNPQKAVPITLTLGKEFDTLIITGPNTGGKTVSLKTIGLLTLMAMCGLMIPADDGSEIAVFRYIFADIGDEQSIEQSLSTFSAHMVNIVQMLTLADHRDLVLFDELCAGTDPVEGAALAKAILMELAKRGVKTVATTHYAELKAYALETDGVCNAGCEFDVESLRPTYRLIIGMPGRSNAFAISGRLGLSESVIQCAKAQISAADMRFEKVVAGLELARHAAEEEQNRSAKLRLELTDAKKKAEQAEHELRLKRERIMKQTREQAAAVLNAAREQAARLLNELEDTKKQLTAENAARALDDARAAYKKSIRQIENEADPIEDVYSDLEKPQTLPEKNSLVFLPNIGRDAVVLEVDEKKNRLSVMSGAIKMWVPLTEVRLKKNNISSEQPKTRRLTAAVARGSRSVSPELDLRGMAADEGLLELDRYLDNALLSGLETVRIIHGKGTGVLRKAVQEHLRHHRSVESFRLGTFGEGETGVTVVTLKS